MASRITADHCVRVLKGAGNQQDAAYVVAGIFNTFGIRTTTRAVATCLRGPVNDGRVSIKYRKANQPALYRFVRLKPKGGAA